MKKTFSIPATDIDVKEIENGDFLQLKIYAISTKTNRNKSEFLEESFEDGIKTIYNKPILAYYNKSMNDTEEHNSKVSLDENGELFYDYDFPDAEKPVGVIPESASITIEEVGDKKWIVINPALIWTEYNKRLIDVIKAQVKKKVSVEIESVDSYIDDAGIERIKKWNFLGITILGKNKYGIPVDEAIEGAHLSLNTYSCSKEFSDYKSRLDFAINSNGKYSSSILSKYGVSFYSSKEYGKGKQIPVDKSKESVSNDSWGDIDKTSLRNKVLEAKNYKTLVNSVYLYVGDGWEDSPSEKLKYPVMQYKNGKFVYNSNALLSAQQYGEKYDKNVAKKAYSIRKKLGLLPKESEEKMKRFIESAKKNGYSCVGFFDDKFMFIKDCDMEKEDMVEKKEICVYDVDKDEVDCDDDCDCEDFAWDEITGRSIDLTTRDDGNRTDYAECEKEEMAKRVAELEEENKRLMKRCDEAEEELKEIRMAKFKEDTDAILADEISEVDEKTREELSAMRDEGKFSSVEEFTKELAYRKYVNKKEMAKKTGKLSFGIEKKLARTENKNNLVDKLKQI